jgi:hypothetical protein
MSAPASSRRSATARAGEVQRCLTITAALVHAGGVLGDEPNENVRAVEMRGRARIGNGAGSDQALRRRAGRTVQRMKPARPPLAPPVRVGAEFEQQVHDRKIVGVRNDRRGIEAEHGIVDPRAQLGMLLKEAS